MRLAFPDTIRTMSTDEQVAFLGELPQNAVDEHLTEVADEVLACLPEDAQLLGSRVVAAAHEMGLAERYTLLQTLHGYAAAFDQIGQGDFRRPNVIRSLRGQATLAERKVRDSAEA